MDKNPWMQLSETLAQVVRRVGPSVVPMVGRGDTFATATVYSADGLLVMAAHVIEEDEQVRASLPDGSLVEAELLGQDAGTDVALVRAKTASLPVTPWTGVDDLAVGNVVLALAHPGKTVRARMGIVGALGGEWRTEMGSRVDHYLEADVGVWPGFSGGPLVSVDEKVVGMNTSGLVRGTVVAVPHATVRRVVEEILQHGKVRRGYLGVSSQPARVPSALVEQAGTQVGLLVSGVAPDGPAGRAGVLMGDTLLTLDGAELPHPCVLLGLLDHATVGRTVKLRLIRAGALHEVDLTVGPRP